MGIGGVVNLKLRSKQCSELFDTMQTRLLLKH